MFSPNFHTFHMHTVTTSISVRDINLVHRNQYTLINVLKILFGNCCIGVVKMPNSRAAEMMQW